jgi:hypothetical protein
MKGLAEATYQVLVVANGHRMPVVEAEVAGDRTTTVLARVWSRAEPITGRVVDVDGNGVGDVTVELAARTVNADGAQLAFRDTLSAADGSFRMEGSPEWGPMELRLRDGDSVVVNSAADSPFELVVGRRGR